MVSRRFLLGISAAVWLLAGFFVCHFGVMEYPSNFSLLLVGFTIVIFVPFFFMFQKMTVKNRRRIVNLPSERNNPLTFFTPRTYAIIAFMMTLGVVLRHLPAVPRFFIAFFYVGLGTALFIAGLRYLENVLHFGRYDVEDRTV